MEFDKHNYSYFMEQYCNGSMDDSLREAFEEFMANNPELWDTPTILQNEGKIIYSDKNKLKKESISLSNHTEFFVRAIDGDLTSVEKTALDIFLKNNPSLQSDFSIFQKTKLTPDKSILFPEKSTLKQIPNKKNKAGYYYYLAIAASFLILVTIASLFTSDKNKSHISEKGNTSVKKNITPSASNKFAKKSTGNFVEEKTSALETLGKKEKKRKTNKIKLKIDPATLVSNELATVENINKAIHDSMQLKSVASLGIVEDVNKTDTTSSFIKNTNTLVVYTYQELVAKKEVSWKSIFPKEQTNENKKQKTLLAKLALVLSKLSNKKINYSPIYNENTELMAYTIETNRFSITKEMETE